MPPDVVVPAVATATPSRALVRQLSAALGPDAIRTAPTALEPFSADGLPTRRIRPGCVVFPGSRDEVVAVVAACREHGVPFVARGAGTGLSGGSLGNGATVVVALTRLTRILRIDPANRLAVVEPGVVNARLTQAVRSFGLHYAPDPSSQTSCTIGGNVAENAGGPHCLKYGVTSQHVLQLEVVLPDGTVAILGSPSGEPWGPDLVSLFVGSEGTFGITTAITVRLTPLPNAVTTLLADFASLRQAGHAVSRIVASGIVPAAMEMMDQNCIRAVEASVYAAGYPTAAAAVLLVELDGPNDELVARETREVETMLREAGAGGIRVASDSAERARLWQGRKKAFGALGRISRDLVVQDAVVPRTALPHVLEGIAEIASRHRLVVSNVFHAGDGNLHPNLNFDARDPVAVARVEAASAEIMALCIAAGGTITGEHGVGLDKLRYMPEAFDGVSLALMDRVRRAFDPARRSNPGKVIPLRACREWSGVVREAT